MKEKIEKLPKWVQEHIKDLERQREVAVKALNEYCDSQTPSKFYIEEYECIGENGSAPSLKKRYVQTHKIDVLHNGVHLAICIDNNDALSLKWEGLNYSLEEIAFVPTSYQQARLVSKPHMRS